MKRLRCSPPLIRLGQGSYQRDLRPTEFRQSLDLFYLLCFIIGLLLGWLLAI